MTVLAMSIFLMFYDMDIRGKVVRDIVKSISLWSLDIFLCSSLFDAYLNPYFKAHYF